MKLYAVSAAMALTALLSTIFLGYAVQLHAFGGYLVTVLSMCGVAPLKPVPDLRGIPIQVILVVKVEKDCYKPWKGLKRMKTSRI